MAAIMLCRWVAEASAVSTCQLNMKQLAQKSVSFGLQSLLGQIVERMSRISI